LVLKLWSPSHNTLSERAQHGFGRTRGESTNLGGILVTGLLVAGFRVKTFWLEQDLLFLTSRMMDRVEIDGRFHVPANFMPRCNPAMD